MKILLKNTLIILSLLLLSLILLYKKYLAPKVIAPKLKPSQIVDYVKSIGGTYTLGVVVYSHAYIETGDFSSNIYRACVNLFGMGRVYTRKTTQVDYKDFGSRPNEPRYMGVYSDWKSAIDDWFLWFEFHGLSIKVMNQMSLYDILEFMKNKKYYVISLDKYYARVNKIYQKLMN